MSRAQYVCMAVIVVLYSWLLHGARCTVVSLQPPGASTI